MERFSILRTRTSTEKEKEKENISNCGGGGGSYHILRISSSSSLNAEISGSSSSSSMSPPRYRAQQQQQHLSNNNTNNSHDNNSEKKVKTSSNSPKSMNDNNNNNNNKSNNNKTSTGTSTTGTSTISRMGFMVLILLAVQNCSKNLIVRHVMIQQEAKFLTSAAVLSSECLKLACSIMYILLVERRSMSSIIYYMRQNIQHSLLLIIPASAYNLQSSLEYVALANLNAAMFSVLVQTKLLCTALFAWLVLRKRLQRIQIISLILLTTGVMLCNMQQQQQQQQSNSHVVDTTMTRMMSTLTVQQQEAEQEEEYGRQTKGILATLGIALSSGFASVYTEKFIKGSAAQSSQTLSLSSSSRGDKQQLVDPELEALRGRAVMDNKDSETSNMTTVPSSSSSSSSSSSYGLAYTQVQLAVMSILTIGLYAAMMDWYDIVTCGLFCNFSNGAMITVCISALGGLIVASVLKYADSILKGYATALSVILTGILSRILFDTQLSVIYFLGIINVVTAVILYNGHDLHQYVC